MLYKHLFLGLVSSHFPRGFSTRIVSILDLLNQPMVTAQNMKLFLHVQYLPLLTHFILMTPRHATLSYNSLNVAYSFLRS